MTSNPRIALFFAGDLGQRIFLRWDRPAVRAAEVCHSRSKRFRHRQPIFSRRPPIRDRPKHGQCSAAGIGTNRLRCVALFGSTQTASRVDLSTRFARADCFGAEPREIPRSVVADVLCANAFFRIRSAARGAPLAGIATGGMMGISAIGLAGYPPCKTRIESLRAPALTPSPVVRVSRLS